MTWRRFGDVVVELVQGDITRQPDLDAIVNAANAQLAPGGGVAGAIHRAAGPGLYEECKRLAPIATGEAVVTAGHALPNPRVVHTLGPVYASSQDPPGELAACYRASLRLAEAERLRSIGFPAISTGIFGYPVPEAADVALRAVGAEAPGLTSVQLVRFVLFSASDLDAHERVLAAID